MAMFSFTRFCLRVLADLNKIIRRLKRNVILTIAIDGCLLMFLIYSRFNILKITISDAESNVKLKFSAVNRYCLHKNARWKFRYKLKDVDTLSRTGYPDIVTDTHFISVE
jgi:hypothetical protein